MPPKITFNGAEHDPGSITLSRHTKIDKAYINREIEKQFKLVSHALVRGQNLPEGRNLPNGVTIQLLKEIRIANINEPRERTVSFSE